MENKSDNTVYILDSYGLIFRCYFAFISRPLTNSKGENISALFGFFRNLQYCLTLWLLFSNPIPPEPEYRKPTILFYHFERPMF